VKPDAVVCELVPELRAKRLPLSPRTFSNAELGLPSWAGEEESNLRAKREFRALVLRVLGSRSIREQALFFGVPSSTYNERIRDKRTDLAPLDTWTAKLERHAAWQRLNVEFSGAL